MDIYARSVISKEYKKYGKIGTYIQRERERKRGMKGWNESSSACTGWNLSEPVSRITEGKYIVIPRALSISTHTIK